MAKRGHANTLVKIKKESFTVLAWIDFMSRSTHSRSRTPNLTLWCDRFKQSYLTISKMFQ